MKEAKTIHLADIDFLFAIETDGAGEASIHLEGAPTGWDDTYLVYLTIEAKGEFAVTNFSIEWTVPIVDMNGLYWGGNPREELSYLPYWHISKHICANTGFPYIALIHRSGENRVAVGSCDQLSETLLSADLSEAERSYHFRLQKPDNPGQVMKVVDTRKEIFFVSRARRPWPEVLQIYEQLCDQETRPLKMPVPDHAFDPAFCTWTAIYHRVSHEWIMHNAQIAAELGFRTWITDDGWFIETGRFSDYGYAGDWLPCASKFPDMKAHVHAVQALGFRYMLWIAPFMVGDESEAAKRYTDLLTTGKPQGRFHNLSPQSAETKEIVATIIERLVRDYDLDGLKIDFVDSIKPGNAAPQLFGESLHAVMRESIERALALQPDLLVEFRNPYANLASRSYSNIYRCSDVPLNCTINRWQAVMLRLLAPDRAVHLDPALWHPDESDENVAVHLINVLVSVPMISVELDRYPKTHLDLIRYWIGFYNTHRNTIIGGQFKPALAPGHIPLITFVGAEETIIGVYEAVSVASMNQAVVWILNASARPYVDFEPAAASGLQRVITRDKYGTVVGENTLRFPQTRLPVEVGGSIEIQGIN